MRSIVFAALMMFAGQVFAVFEDGNSLKRLSSDNSNYLRGVYSGYVGSVADILQGGGSISGWKACIPAGVALEQVGDIVKKFLTDNPQFLHYAGASLAANALAEAFPCKK